MYSGHPLMNSLCLKRDEAVTCQYLLSRERDDSSDLSKSNGFRLLGQLLVHAHGVVSTDNYLNKCMLLLPEYSKDTPSPEPGLECSTFVGNSCCKKGVTLPFMTEYNWQNITDYLHCPQKVALEPQCQKQFFEELCFFLCSPDIGPWIELATHDEPVTDRFKDIPICASVCDQWYNACQDEYTCTDNWYIGFNNTSGMNKCHEGTQCLKYPEYFPTSKSFCENIWDKSFKVVPDDEPCMHFSYDATSGNNPNRAVAEARAKELSTSSSLRIYISQILIVGLAILVYKVNT
ncbi:unnamed protein product [Owenia fusiformis]|uniref:Uncharacterized protein n=1 Tax=Owenia fusiformis TaxID=6347 RepID=A0A8J1XJE5_OWEFU|nr:unnamed protein product [Owenia fusiformis]